LKAYRSLTGLQNDLYQGKISCAELVDYNLNNLEEKKNLNAFVEVFEDDSRRRAQEIDLRISLNKAGQLAGLTVSVKDVLCLENHNTQAGSKILEGFISPYSATAVKRLTNEDAIILGRTNCDEFGMGSTGETSFMGPALNPLDLNRVPGGSSSGSAAAVAAGLGWISLGTDTGGSVRQPAAFCGVIGLKPTYSRISRYGLIAYASSFDTIGIIGNNVLDIARTLEVIAGSDEYDSTVSRSVVPQYSKLIENPAKKLKIGYFKEAMDHPALDPEIKEQTFASIKSLEHQGNTIEAINFELLDYVLPTYYILTAAEAGSNLSRFDGVRYGARTKNESELDNMYRSTRFEGFGEEVRRRIMLGTFVLSASYYDSYFSKAQKVRALLRQKISGLFENYDFIITPTTPTNPYKLGELKDNPLEMYLGDLFTVIASVAGIPAISLPIGRSASGLPIGLQVMAKDFHEAELLSFSNYLLGLVRG